MVKDAWILVFSDVSTGRLFGIALLIVTNEVICTMHSVCIDQVKSYCLKGQLYRKILKDFIENQFSNVVLSPFTTYYTQREVAEKAVNHFGDLGLMEEGCMGSIRIYASIFRRNY